MHFLMPETIKEIALGGTWRRNTPEKVPLRGYHSDEEGRGIRRTQGTVHPRARLRASGPGREGHTQPPEAVAFGSVTSP